MKIALLDVRRTPRDVKKSGTVAYRNLLILQTELQADFYSSASLLKSARLDYDVIICGFGSIATEIDCSTQFLRDNQKAKLYWLVGEYEQSTFQPLFYAKRPYDVIKNFEHHMKGKQINSQYFINLNLLLAKPPVSPNNAINTHSYGVVYYGRWRKDRAQYFQQYLHNPIYVSTSVKNMKKFKSCGASPLYCKPLRWREGEETLRLFRCSLYLEDVFTHTHYNCPANRYYEALFCGSVVIPHIESQNTWEKAGINMSARYVSSYDEMLDKASDKHFIVTGLEQQYDEGILAMKQRASVIKELKEIISSKKT